jgi:uncharacterized membrane protein YdjX (TVP38/TMEM64 family)
MSSRTKLFFLAAIVAFLISAMRFLANPPLSTDALDFIGGVGIGLLIGAIVTWAGERGSV